MSWHVIYSFHDVDEGKSNRQSHTSWFHRATIFTVENEETFTVESDVLNMLRERLAELRADRPHEYVGTNRRQVITWDNGDKGMWPHQDEPRPYAMLKTQPWQICLDCNGNTMAHPLSEKWSEFALSQKARTSCLGLEGDAKRNAKMRQIREQENLTAHGPTTFLIENSDISNIIWGLTLSEQSIVDIGISNQKGVRLGFCGTEDQSVVVLVASLVRTMKQTGYHLLQNFSASLHSELNRQQPIGQQDGHVAEISATVVATDCETGRSMGIPVGHDGIGVLTAGYCRADIGGLRPDCKRGYNLLSKFAKTLPGRGVIDNTMKSVTPTHVHPRHRENVVMPHYKPRAIPMSIHQFILTMHIRNFECMQPRSGPFDASLLHTTCMHAHFIGKRGQTKCGLCKRAPGRPNTKRRRTINFMVKQFSKRNRRLNALMAQPLETPRYSYERSVALTAQPQVQIMPQDIRSDVAPTFKARSELLANDAKPNELQFCTWDQKEYDEWHWQLIIAAIAIGTIVRPDTGVSGTFCYDR